MWPQAFVLCTDVNLPKCALPYLRGHALRTISSGDPRRAGSGRPASVGWRSQGQWPSLGADLASQRSWVCLCVHTECHCSVLGIVRLGSGPVSAAWSWVLLRASALWEGDSGLGMSFQGVCVTAWRGGCFLHCWASPSSFLVLLAVFPRDGSRNPTEGSGWGVPQAERPVTQQVTWQVLGPPTA